MWHCDALQLEAARCRASRSPLFITMSIRSSKSANLSVPDLAYNVPTADTLRYAVTLTFDTLTLNVYTVSAVTQPSLIY